MEPFGPDAGHRYLPVAHIDQVRRLPYVLRIMLENQLRAGAIHDPRSWVEGMLAGDPGQRPVLSFSPSRVVMQDFTALPAMVDLAAMRDSVAARGGSPDQVRLQIPGQLVVDHSLAADSSGRLSSYDENIYLEYKRNSERYTFFKWARENFEGFSIVPPGQGIVHQVNLEYLAEVVTIRDGIVFPDSVVGTDSHTSMINGLGVVGWGVGGIEAELALLGEPLPIIYTGTLGCPATGQLRPGVTTTDLLLSMTEVLRSLGVVGRMLEFFGPGVANLTVAERASISNMCPEYGATCAYFPIDAQTLSYLRDTGRPGSRITLVEEYARRQLLWADEDGDQIAYDQMLEFDLDAVQPCVAGPSRPQDRVALGDLRADAEAHLIELHHRRAPATRRAEAGLMFHEDGSASLVPDGAVAIAAITSCTNTSNPALMIGAGLLAQKALAAGLATRPWVKTSLAPGSRVVMRYLRAVGLVDPLEKLGFFLVGYGCTTCAGNSGDLDPDLAAAARAFHLRLAAVLSGNRNFESRIHPEVDLAYLASPALVVAFALAGNVVQDLTTQPLQVNSEGRSVFLADIWPSSEEIAREMARAIRPAFFTEEYETVFSGDARWEALPTPHGVTFDWNEASTYIRRPPFTDPLPDQSSGIATRFEGVRVLAFLGDSVNTDHISPAGHISEFSPAGRYLADQGVARADFNVYGARRGNHEVMTRGTFANGRLANRLVPGVLGGITRDLESGEVLSIYDAAEIYAQRGTALMIVAGKDYGSGSSRDWAAKGTSLLGVRVVLAESFERIHRSNLVGMGVLPLEFPPGTTADSWGISGEEVWTVRVTTLADDGVPRAAIVSSGALELTARCRIENVTEWNYFKHGGALRFISTKILDAHGNGSDVLIDEVDGPSGRVAG